MRKEIVELKQNLQKQLSLHLFVKNNTWFYFKTYHVKFILVIILSKIELKISSKIKWLKNPQYMELCFYILNKKQNFIVFDDIIIEKIDNLRQYVNRLIFLTKVLYKCRKMKKM